MSDWDEKAVFLTFLGLPEDQREAFLEKACPDDVARDRIRTLLRHHGEASEDFLTERTKTMSEPERPTMIEEFRILHRLGEGGMGVVYLAEDTVLGRKVALKILARHLSGSEQALARFREEARSAAALKHPAIVPVFKFGRDGDDAFLVSELVEGPTLASVIEEKRRTMTGSGAAGMRDWHRHCAEMVAVIADALDSAHRAEIVHRDVKPSNILIDPDRGPRLTDFGIAKHLTEENRNRHTGIIGSCHYMSPEQAAIADTLVDQRSDIFSLGVVLYEMLALRLPFDGKTIHQVLQAVIHREPPRLRTVNRQIPADLETICHKAIEKSPRDRYQSAAHVAADLRCFLRGDPILAKPPSAARRIIVGFRRHRGIVLSLAATLAVLSTVLVSRSLIQDARDSSTAWVHLETGHIPCHVYLQSFDPQTFIPEPNRRFLGKTPLPAQSLSGGQYRLTVIRESDGSAVEFNLVLRDLGPQFTRYLVLNEGGWYPQAARPRALADLGRTMVGVMNADTPGRLDGMMFVKGGEYNFGSETNAGASIPETVILDDFYIDTRKVSNREYAEFVSATGYRRPNFWMDNDPAKILDLPIIGVTLEEAEAYARWRGKRLPTLLEWQAAARGKTGQLYPGGVTTPAMEEPPAELLRSAETTSGERQRAAYMKHALPVRKLDASGPPFQTHSSVRELCGTVSLTNASFFVVGRAWFDPVKSHHLGIISQQPLSFPSPHSGFRCAVSAWPKNNH